MLGEGFVLNLVSFELKSDCRFIFFFLTEVDVHKGEFSKCMNILTRYFYSLVVWVRTEHLLQGLLLESPFQVMNIFEIRKLVHILMFEVMMGMS